MLWVTCILIAVSAVYSVRCISLLSPLPAICCTKCVRFERMIFTIPFGLAVLVKKGKDIHLRDRSIRVQNLFYFSLRCSWRQTAPQKMGEALPPPPPPPLSLSPGDTRKLYFTLLFKSRTPLFFRMTISSHFITHFENCTSKFSNGPVHISPLRNLKNNLYFLRKKMVKNIVKKTCSPYWV